MQNLFTNYYHFGRVWKNDSINKYELIRKLKEYSKFSEAFQKVAHFRPILYQPDHVLVYCNNSKKEEPLTLLVPWNQENKIGIEHIFNDTILFSTTPNYDNIEMFVIEKKIMKNFEFLELHKNGKLKIAMNTIREKAILNEVH